MINKSVIKVKVQIDLLSGAARAGDKAGSFSIKTGTFTTRVTQDDKFIDLIFFFIYPLNCFKLNYE